jgi:tRNA pseudouridine38-40 synthase
MRPTFLSGKVTWDHRSLNIRKMAKAAAALVGRHDFSAYRANACQSRQPIREIQSLEVSGSGLWVWIDIKADGFLYHMVRNIAGVLVAIGSEERPVGWAQEVLESRDRQAGGVTAPPDGLYLTEIRYPEEFELPPAMPACRFW